MKSILTGVFTLSFLLLFISAPHAGETKKDMAQDIWLESKLVTTYTLNEHLNPFRLDVDVEKGVATISGNVDSSVEKSLAIEIARGTDGIKEVKDKISVDPSGKAAGKTPDFARQVNDANLIARVKFNLLWNRDTSGLRIDVDAKDGVITLAGKVSSSAEKDLAAELAQNTSGVQRVENTLTIDSKPDKPGLKESLNKNIEETRTAFSDSWITAKVKSRLLYDKNTDGLDISVTTKNGVVTLEGVVDSRIKKDYALTAVSNIKSVIKVVDKLTVTGG